MYKVALTGGIATGKSYVAARLEEGGVATIDADAIVGEALQSGTTAAAAIGRAFGAEVLNQDGSVNRAVMARTAFADASARARLEAILHPLVYETIARWYAVLDASVGVASIPLLFETKGEDRFDAVVVVACSVERQIARLRARGLDEEEARLRLAAQWSTEEKIKRADFLISTDGTPADTDAQVVRLIASFSGRG